MIADRLTRQARQAMRLLIALLYQAPATRSDRRARRRSQRAYRRSRARDRRIWAARIARGWIPPSRVRWDVALRVKIHLGRTTARNSVLNAIIWAFGHEPVDAYYERGMRRHSERIKAERRRIFEDQMPSFWLREARRIVLASHERYAFAENVYATTTMPGAVDTYPTHVDNVNEVIAAAFINNLQDAVRAMEKIVVGPLVQNVKGQGAAGNGSSDDTAFLVAANTAGGEIYLPYYVFATQGFTLGAGNSLRGPGTLKLLSGGATVTVTCSTDNKISEITLNNNAIANSVGIEMGGTSARTQLTNLTFVGGNSGGYVHFSGAAVDASITSCTFTGAGMYGILAANTCTVDRVSVTANTFSGLGGADAVEFNTPTGRVTHITVTGNTISACNIGIGFARCQNVSIAANTITGCTGATPDSIHIEDASYDVTIFGNTISGGAGAGIMILPTHVAAGPIDGRECIVSKNIIKTCALSGIVIGGVSSGSTDFVISKNIVKGCGSAGANTWGIDLGYLQNNVICTFNIVSNSVGLTDSAGIATNTSTNVYIFGNRCYDDGTGTQKYGLRANAAHTNLVVEANNFANNATAAIKDNSSGGIFRRNIGYNPVGGAVTTPGFPATTVTITNTTGVDVTSYITNGTSALTVAIDGTTMFVIPASQVAPIRIPANSTFTPTFAGGAPAHKWYGE